MASDVGYIAQIVFFGSLAAQPSSPSSTIGDQIVANLKDTLINQGLQIGMSAVQKVLNSPIGPAMMRSIGEILKVKQNLDEARERLLERLQIASYQEQAELRRTITTLEKKLERMERRMREMQKQNKDHSDAQG